MDTKNELIVLTFLSCVGMLMNSDFVSYAEMRKLMDELPIPQSRMQQLHLQSSFTLPYVRWATVWRLHEDIEYKLGTPANKPPPVLKRKSEEEEGPPEQPVEDVQEVDVEDISQYPPTQKTRYLPNNWPAKWTEEEVALISTDAKVPLRVA